MCHNVDVENVKFQILTSQYKKDAYKWLKCSIL